MQDTRCATCVIVLLSTALVKPEGNTTEGDLDGIYPHGWVHVRPQPASWPGTPIARLRAWQRLGKTRLDSL
jgi:hypothetical protein